MTRQGDIHRLQVQTTGQKPEAFVFYNRHYDKLNI